MTSVPSLLSRREIQHGHGLLIGRKQLLDVDPISPEIIGVYNHGAFENGVTVRGCPELISSGRYRVNYEPATVVRRHALQESCVADCHDGTGNGSGTVGNSPGKSTPSFART